MTQPIPQFTTEYQEALPVHIFRTRNDEGARCFFVLRTSSLQIAKLRAKKGKEEVDIADYGEVLASGYGTHPNARICAMLKKRYGIEFEPEEE